jgi:WhiB family redox-sensing transcriptional regulator
MTGLPMELLLGKNISWMNYAACKDVDPLVFFPEHLHENGISGPGAYATARVICGQCKVASQCLDYALATFRTNEEDHGMWGGMSPRERRKYKKQQRANGLANQQSQPASQQATGLVNQLSPPRDSLRPSRSQLGSSMGKHVA